MAIGIQHRFVGELRTLMEKAACGDLDYPYDRPEDSPITPCATQPDIWELRYNVNSGKKYRLYYSESEGRSPELVALHVHEKIVENVSVDEMDDLQNSEMKKAQERYKLYAGSTWGHSMKRCNFCVREQ